MNYKWKIVLAPYLFDDFSDVKVRPILCLTEPIGENFHVVGAFITTRTHFDVQPFDISFDPAVAPWQITGLRVESTLRLHRLTTFDISIARRSLGEWPPEMRRKVEDSLRQLLGL
ncbi:MAG TPA: type II toxin-antitoxin system PemK/MazF family toxin [Abditibacterium sp.]|jgi:mRNA interferase MazF